MASEPETTERGETLAPNLASRHGSRGNTPVNSEALRKNIPEHCSAAQRGKKRKTRSLPKKAKKRESRLNIDPSLVRIRLPRVLRRALQAQVIQGLLPKKWLRLPCLSSLSYWQRSA